MEIQSHIKHIRLSPKKIRFMIDDIKRKSVSHALVSLQADPRRSSVVLYKAIKSAVDNAQRVHGIGIESLLFKHLSVDEGAALRRMRPESKGRAHFFKKRSSHIKVVLMSNKNIKQSEKKAQVKAIENEKTPKVDQKKPKQLPVVKKTKTEK